MTDVSDAMLAAYVDDELQPDERKRVEAAAAGDARLAARLAAHGRLRSRIGDAFAGVLSQPVPEAMMRVAAADDTGANADRTANVVVFQRKTARSGIPWPWAAGGALAAGLAAGVVLSPALSSSGGAALIGPDMAARGALAQALETQLASQPSSGPVRIGVTFRTAEGHVCRSFNARSDVAGLACRGDKAGWTVRMAVAAPALDTAAYRTATSPLPQPVADLAQSLEVGQPMNADGESKAKSAGWR